MFSGELFADAIKYLLPSAATGAALKAVTFREGIKSGLRSGAMHHGSLEPCLVFLLCVLFSHALIIHASFSGFPRNQSLSAQLNTFFHSADQNEKSNFGGVAFGVGEMTGIALMSTRGLKRHQFFVNTSVEVIQI